MKTFLMAFGLIFLAELGDKTQLATFAYAAKSESRFSVFVGAALALVLTTLLGVLLGEAVARTVPPKAIRVVAGVLFLGFGVWILLGK